MTSSRPPARLLTAVAEGPLSVFADLRVETGGHRVQLVGDGQSLVLHTDHPLALLAAVNELSLPAGTGGRRAVGRLAGTLTGAGLRIDVRGPNGLLVSLGKGAGSPLGRLLTGSRSVEFGPARDIAGALSSGVRRWTFVAAAIAGAAGASTAAGGAAVPPALTGHGQRSDHDAE